MKVIFVRHGEAMDDLENRYGGWYDPDLSPKGQAGAINTGKKLQAMAIKPDTILTSPFKRALQTAKGMATILNCPTESFVYLKERNTYGLLCGEIKQEAKQRYPELVSDYEQGRNLLGCEDYAIFLQRVKILLSKLATRKESVLICITHGKLLGAIFKDILNKETKKFHDNCIIEVSLDHQGNLQLISTDGVDF